MKESTEENEGSEAEHSGNTQESREMIDQRESRLCAGAGRACEELTQALEDGAAE